MGSSKVALLNDAGSRREYYRHLMDDMTALRLMLERDLFEKDRQRIGFELELSLADRNWRPAPVGPEILERSDDEFLAPELGRFNLEINLPPKSFAAGCLFHTQRELEKALDRLSVAAKKQDARPVLTGILPSISRRDLTMENMTPLPRFKFLVDELRRARRSLFQLHIEGIDQLILADIPVMYEACNTSFQVHLQVSPDTFRPLYNWANAIAGPQMASCTNSPLLLGRRLWRESRIALYRQTTDTRHASKLLRQHDQRVSLGWGWVQHSALDVFQADIARLQPLLRPISYQASLVQLESGQTPKLKTLNTHNGTSYKWNRACYGITEGQPHLRIENRLIPTGPTVTDQVANAAFWLGMMNGMPDEYDNIHQRMDFFQAKNNFLSAARQGLGAHFNWPGLRHKIPAEELIIKELLPIAEQGLQKAGVTDEEVGHYLSVIRERVTSGQTGSQWLVDTFSTLKEKSTRHEAMVGTTALLYQRQQSGLPVHTWAPATLDEARCYYNPHQQLDLLMQTDLYTIREDDLLQVAVNIMEWFRIRHLPVENEAGEVVGIITSRNLAKRRQAPIAAESGPEFVKDVMDPECLLLPPQTSTREAVAIMRERGSDFVLIGDQGRLIGILTDTDLAGIQPVPGPGS